ncbi:MAG: helix-turn-helix domain-containing protein [Lachnospiraceae bacterium]|nr:helix-turn-helix domain-containing protein [Lachnospiraceae bacterium]
MDERTLQALSKALAHLIFCNGAVEGLYMEKLRAGKVCRFADTIKLQNDRKAGNGVTMSLCCLFFMCKSFCLPGYNAIDNTSVNRYVIKKEEKLMIINELLQKENMSRYRLSKESGVAMTTITDICSGKAELDKCTAGTLYKIAKVLGVTVDSILENNHVQSADYRCSFETFKSNTCHHVKELGDIDFIIETLEADEIRKLYNRQWYRETLYLLAMVDYLSRLNHLPICTNYNDIRRQKLEKLYFPAGVLVSYAATGDERIKNEALANAIPEFLRFNIVESEVRNVC